MNNYFTNMVTKIVANWNNFLSRTKNGQFEDLKDSHFADIRKMKDFFLMVIETCISEDFQWGL